MTLYYFTPDAPTKLACSGDCAQAWPPLLSTGSDTPTSTTSLPGTLSILKDANGSQVEYNGYLLYTYIKDTVPGTVTGQGVGKSMVCCYTCPGIIYDQDSKSKGSWKSGNDPY